MCFCVRLLFCVCLCVCVCVVVCALETSKQRGLGPILAVVQQKKIVNYELNL